MSSKKSTEMLGETHLPEDLLTPSLGSSYGIGEYPELNYGAGVLEGLVPEGQGPESGVPDGIVKESEGVGDLEEYMKSASQSLMDLDWLELAEQDPDRLPHDTTDTMIGELEEAWGIDRRTDGISVVPNVDLEIAQFQQSVENDVRQYKSAGELQGVLRKAVRRATAGHPLKAILREAAEALGEDAPRLKSAMEKLREEYGLLGNVFIRAAAYPGYEQGKWKQTIKKDAANARYIIVDERTLTNGVHIQDGHCMATKKKAVTAVPWKAAVAHYSPRLAASGRPVKGKDAQRALKRAFALDPVAPTDFASDKPVPVLPVDRVSLEDARRVFADTIPVLEYLGMSRKEAFALSERENLNKQLVRWQFQGFLTRADTTRLRASKAAPRDVLRTAAHLIASVQRDDFSGLENQGRGVVAEVTADQAWTALQDAEHRAKQATDFLREALRQKHENVVQRQAAGVIKEIKRGLRGPALLKHIVNTFDKADLKAASLLLDPVLKKTGALEPQKQAAVAYSGNPNDVRAQSISAQVAWDKLKLIEAPVRVTTPHKQMVATLARWVRDGLLSKQQATLLTASDNEPEAILRQASALITSAKQGAFSGQVSHHAVLRNVGEDQVRAEITAAEKKKGERNAKAQAEGEKRKFEASREGRHHAVVLDKVDKIRSAIDRGLKGQPLIDMMKRIFTAADIPLARGVLDPLLAKTGAHRIETAEARKYEGVKFERNQGKHATEANTLEVRKFLRWARQQMSEGFLGNDLSDLLRTRYSGQIRKAASVPMAEMRDRHEGLAGFLYVDTEAYASKAGKTGCEKGALRHRANQLKFALAMDRCGSCALRGKTAEGLDVCSAYNKILVARDHLPVDAAAYQAEQIQLASASDAEQDAALFVRSNNQVLNAFNPEEFKLGSDDEMDDLSFEEMSDSEDLGAVFFGGMEWD